MTEEKKKWTFFLACTKCAFKFSIERDSPDMNKVNITEMKCLECQSPIQWDTSNFPASIKPSTEGQSRMNTETSMEAIRMASAQKKADAEAGIGKLVPVRSTQKGKNFGKTEMIPEETIKSIERKVGTALDEIKEE